MSTTRMTLIVAAALCVGACASTNAGQGGLSPAASTAPAAVPAPQRVATPGATKPSRSAATMAIPAWYASLVGTYPKLATAVTLYHKLPAAGQTTITGISEFVAQNPTRAQTVCTGLGEVLTGEVTVPGLTVPATLGLPTGVDIQALAFIVLMQATDDEDNDLSLIMAETKAETNAKQYLRNQLAVVDQDVANNAAQQTSGPDGQPTTAPSPTPSASGRPLLQISPLKPNFETTFQLPRVDDDQVVYYAVDLTNGQPLTSIDQLKSIQGQLQGDLDSMNEMSELTAMRLQMAMDRRSKFVQDLVGQIDATSYPGL